MTYGEQKKGRQKVGWQEELEKGRVEARWRREEGRPEVLAQVVAEEGRAQVVALSFSGGMTRKPASCRLFCFPLSRIPPDRQLEDPRDQRSVIDAGFLRGH